MPPATSSKPTSQQAINVKLLLIGNSSVGKSSLLLRFSDEQWLPEDESSATIGVDFRVHKMEVNGKKVKLSIWDTAGQERFRTITSSYYRGAQGIILVYDVANRESFDALPRWYSELETYVSDSVVKILVGNKVDKEYSRQVTVAEGQQFANRMKSLFIEASAKTAIGVKDIFRELVEEILNTPELWDNASNKPQNTAHGNGGVPGANMSRKWPENARADHQFNAASRTPVPRPFLPPSYYAAAGGIPYPRKQKTNEAARTQTNPEQPDRSAGDRIPRLQPPPAYVPSGSESSFEIRGKGPHQKLTGDVKPALSTRPPSAKRQGLPNVEAQLLPSLQSTIHRMTRPPSRVLAESTNSPHFDNHHDNLKRKPSPNPNYTSPVQDANANPSQDVPKSRIPQKPLKSALRTPQASKPVSSPKPPEPVAPAASPILSPRRNSLRNVKSLLYRKLGNAPSPQIGPPTPKPASSSPYPPSQPRDEVRTITTPNPNSTHTSHLPRPKFKLERPTVPATTQQHVQAAQHPTSSAHANANATHTDESDIENKYQRQWMERRRLTVANAEVPSSTSSSDGSSMDIPYDAMQTPKIGIGTYNGGGTGGLQRHGWKSPLNPSLMSPNPNAKSRPAGLGLNVNVHAMQKQPPSSFNTAPTTTPSTAAPHTTSNSPLLPTVELGAERDNRTKILRFSLPPSGSDASLYSNHQQHQVSYPGSWDSESSDYQTESEDGETIRGAMKGSGSGGRGYEDGKDVNSGDEYEYSEPESEAESLGPPSHVRQQQQQQRSPRDGRPSPSANAWRQAPSLSHRAGGVGGAVPRDYRPTADPKYQQQQPQHPSPMLRHPADLGGQRPGQWSGMSPRLAPKQMQMPATPRIAPEVSNAWFNESSRDYDDLEEGLDRIPRFTPRRRAPHPPTTTTPMAPTTAVQTTFESSSISQLSRRHAAQQREAFGIPASVSDEAIVNAPSLSTASSEMSCYEEDGQFSNPTENTSAYDCQATPPQTRRCEDRTANSQGRDHQQRSREEIILEFYRSEETFLSNTHLCVDLFILPIRNENSRSWIGGVPPSISRLLDWYEDIVNLHLAISQSLESSAAMQGGDIVVSGLANYLVEFVGKLHVYQPYLVNLGDALEEVAGLVEDGNSDFGEFLRIQEGSLKNAGWTFERLLMEPVNRLAVYQEMFGDLLEATPQDHPEFLPTMMLAKSVDTVMKAMMEISDPGISGVLASRERRLLYSGTLRLVSPANLATAQPQQQHTQSHKDKAQKRSSKLVQAITNWDRKPPERSSSMKSTASSVTNSVKSYNTMSSYDPPGSMDSRSAKLPLFKGLFKAKAAAAGISSSSGQHLGLPSVPPGFVQVFVFSDIVLLILPKPAVDAKYDLVPKLGLARVFSVASGGGVPPDG
ncbi:hypothetical protein EST38_g8471 [Candolleomyces aberdarensis]|uniref:DH domain-containing protein n=1 Tax=Candolleomyces aberdarensis TaxID=2316362 RepID=A0A4Q2DD56_9AGAR|nr:hypothetical protein EST38_g8471 [Candolleomyces aberdarensis]